MKIVAWVDGYPPNHCTGATMMLHEILLDLQTKGHEVRVFDLRHSSTIFENIEVVSVYAGKETEAYEWADVVLTQTSATHNANRLFSKRCPVVYINHDPTAYSAEVPRQCQSLLSVFNSEWASKVVQPISESFVLQPPVDPAKYKTERGECITLVNLNQNKGGHIFWQLVEALPNHRFLGVEGSYGHQIKSSRPPANVEIQSTTTDMRSVYSRSRIVIMPSKIETYGRIAIEAFASGIPVIASPTVGLKEALGDAGIFVSSRRVEDWVEQISKLNDPNEYASASELAYKRSAELHPSKSLDKFEESLFLLCTNFKEM